MRSATYVLDQGGIGRPRISVGRFNTDSIVHGESQLLFASEVLLRCLHACVSEKELDLLQLTSCLVTQPCTCASQIVRRKVPDFAFQGKLFDHTPDHFWLMLLPHT